MNCGIEFDYRQTREELRQKTERQGINANKVMAGFRRLCSQGSKPTGEMIRWNNTFADLTKLEAQEKNGGLPEEEKEKIAELHKLTRNLFGPWTFNVQEGWRYMVRYKSNPKW